MAVIRIIEPPAALLSPAEARLIAPVLADRDDEGVAALLSSAQNAIEPGGLAIEWGRAFGEQTLEAVFDGWPGGPLALPFPVIRAVEAVNWLDEAGVLQTLPPEGWRLAGADSHSPQLICTAGSGWPPVLPGPETVTVRYRAGYAAGDSRLRPVREAVALMASQAAGLAGRDLTISAEIVPDVYERRWTVSDTAARLMAEAAGRLLAPYRVYYR